MNKISSWYFNKQMKSIDELEKENRKYKKQIETLLKRTIKYWRKKEWSRCKPNYYLEIAGKHYKTSWGEEKYQRGKVLVEYSEGSKEFTYKTDDYDFIVNTLVELIENKLEKTKEKNHKLYWFLKDLKTLFFK